MPSPMPIPQAFASVDKRKAVETAKPRLFYPSSNFLPLRNTIDTGIHFTNSIDFGGGCSYI